MRKRFFDVVSWVCLVVAFAFLIIFMCRHAVQLTNSDMASEMILGKILSEEKAVITPNWYYSTELRVLNFAKYCHFLTWGGIEFRKFSFNGIINIFFGVLRILGYSYGDVKAPLASAFSCLLAVIIVISILKSICNNIEVPDKIWLLSVYIVCAFAVLGGFIVLLICCIVTDMVYRSLCLQSQLFL